MQAEMEQRKMQFNLTTPHVTPINPKWGIAAYYTLIPLALLALIGCVVAVVGYIRRKARLDELRHRLIPLYSYDPAEEQGWRDDEEEELVEPLYNEGKLSFSSGYRM